MFIILFFFSFLIKSYDNNIHDEFIWDISIMTNNDNIQFISII